MELRAGARCEGEGTGGWEGGTERQGGEWWPLFHAQTQKVPGRSLCQVSATFHSLPGTDPAPATLHPSHSTACHVAAEPSHALELPGFLPSWSEAADSTQARDLGGALGACASTGVQSRLPLRSHSLRTGLCAVARWGEGEATGEGNGAAPFLHLSKTPLPRAPPHSAPRPAPLSHRGTLESMAEAPAQAPRTRAGNGSASAAAGSAPIPVQPWAMPRDECLLASLKAEVLMTGASQPRRQAGETPGNGSPAIQAQGGDVRP